MLMLLRGWCLATDDDRDDNANTNFHLNNENEEDVKNGHGDEFYLEQTFQLLQSLLSCSQLSFHCLPAIIIVVINAMPMMIMLVMMMMSMNMMSMTMMMVATITSV